ncbi:MAG TPA: methyltransferase domain-containing protein [Chloroflexota bacterium]|nr:methyltransferase domain-containing protein [Chloroflexota bacterium]
MKDKPSCPVRSRFTLPIVLRRSTPEILDRPGLMADHLDSNLADIRRLNLLLGERAMAVRLVTRLARRGDSILDVGTGSADIPLAVYRRLRRMRLEPSITACDVSPEILEVARRHVGTHPIALQQGDARCLPYHDHTFDVVLCCLALHHFEPTEARQVLAELWRVCRRAVVVLDLERGRAAYAGTWLATRLLARDPVTRHDGPLSVLRAYTRPELAELARAAGIPNAVVIPQPLFRMALVAQR